MTSSAQSFLQKMYDHPSFKSNEGETVNFDFESDSALTAKPAVNLDVQRVLYHYAEQCRVRFHLAGNAISPSQVFGESQFLPIIGLDAMRIWHSLQQSSTGRNATGNQPFYAHVEPDPNGLFAMRCKPKSIQSDLTSTLRLLVWTLSARRVMELRLDAHIDLNQRILAWDAQNLSINWSDPLLPQIPLPKGMDMDFFINEFDPVVHVQTDGVDFDQIVNTEQAQKDKEQALKERAHSSARHSNLTQR